MSAEATGWVFRFSPMEGTAFTVHLAIADSVNDQNDNEFWMSAGNLAAKARCSRSTARNALAAMVELGLLLYLDEPGAAQRARRAVRYRFLMPEGLADQRPPLGQSPAKPLADQRPRTQVVTQEDPSEPRAPRARNLVFDALAEVFPASTAAENRRIGVVTAQLKQVKPEPPPDLVRAAARWVRREWPEATVMAVANNWTLACEHVRGGRGNPAARRFWEDESG